MTAIPFLLGKDIYLRALVDNDSEGPYSTWFNDAEVCKGNSHHIYPHSINDVLDYIKSVNRDHFQLILAIVDLKDESHVGNIGLDKINHINRTADLTIIIGDKSYWGRGYGKEAASLICNHGFFVLNLNRIGCGTFENNARMRKLAKYLGMVEEGRRRQAVYKLGRYVDVIEYGVLRSEYIARFSLEGDEEGECHTERVVI